MSAIRATAGTSPGRARVVLRVDNADHRWLGENVLVHYCVENTSASKLIVGFGGDYRGATRSLRFKVTVKDAQGKLADDPDPSEFNFGGMSHDEALEPGKSYCQSLPLMRYARIDAPGTYSISVTHDLGWTQEPAPVGDTKVTLLMPDAAQAEAVLAAMESLKPEIGTAGQLSPPQPDYAALRYSVYLASLEKRARAGDERALEGLGEIPTTDATRALLKLTEHSRPELAKRAARVLAMRLPDPALSGKLGPRNPFFNELSAQRKYLISVGWDHALEDPVRAKAKKLLASNDDDDLKSGAFFLEAVGTTAENPALVDALTRAIAKTVTEPRETQISPPPRGACEELRRATDVLLDRGLTPVDPPKTLGEFAQWLASYRLGARPKLWESTLKAALRHSNTYVRRVALESMTDVPPDFLREVGDNLAVSDRDVRNAALGLAQSAKVKAFGPRIAGLIARTDDDWSLSVLWNASRDLDARVPAAQALIARLTEPKFGGKAMSMLLDLFDAGGRSGSTEIDPKDAKRMQVEWTKYVAAHKTELTTGKIPLTADTEVLVPAGWTFSRSGLPDWPVRGH